MADGETYIYVLRDPDSGLVRYVGKTRDPAARLDQHRGCSDKTKCHRTRWLARLRREGKAPTMEVVEVVPHGGDWSGAERDWIDRGLALGWPLTNTYKTAEHTAPSLFGEPGGKLGLIETVEGARVALWNARAAVDNWMRLLRRDRPTMTSREAVQLFGVTAVVCYEPWRAKQLFRAAQHGRVSGLLR